MTKYRIAQDADYHSFTVEVEDALANGWICQGGVFIREFEGHLVYYQALVK